MLPVSLILLAIIALVLHIVFGYLGAPEVRYRPIVAVIIIITVLLLWFVLPVHIGGQS